jgi:hypothetical protein
MAFHAVAFYSNLVEHNLLRLPLLQSSAAPIPRDVLYKIWSVSVILRPCVLIGFLEDRSDDLNFWLDAFELVVLRSLSWEEC